MTSRHGVSLTCAIVFAIASRESGAQTCRGRPGFAKSRVMLNAGGMMASDVRSVSGGVTVGSADEGPLGSVAVGYVVREASPTFSSDQTGYSLGAGIAYEGTELSGRLAICPGVGVSRLAVTGDFFGTEATLTQNQKRAGVSAGYLWPASRTVTLIPFASVEYVWFGGSVSNDDFDLPVPEDTYLPVTAGLGTAWSETLGISAAVVIPTGVPTAHHSFVLSVAWALGKRN